MPTDPGLEKLAKETREKIMREGGLERARGRGFMIDISVTDAILLAAFAEVIRRDGEWLEEGLVRRKNPRFALEMRADALSPKET